MFVRLCSLASVPAMRPSSNVVLSPDAKRAADSIEAGVCPTG